MNIQRSSHVLRFSSPVRYHINPLSRPDPPRNCPETNFSFDRQIEGIASSRQRKNRERILFRNGEKPELMYIYKGTENE